MPNRDHEDRWRYRIGGCTGFERPDTSLLIIFPLSQNREDIKGHANIQLCSALDPQLNPALIFCTGSLIDPLRS